MKINKNSLQARIKNIRDKLDVPSNVILQNYFFDRFLMRLSKSKYSNNFIFKGGQLLSSYLGLEFRSTLDMDFCLNGFSLEKEIIFNILDEIINIDVGDLVSFEIKEISNIREIDIYGGYNVALLARLENIKTDISIDIATGDPITPNAILHSYKCLFEEKSIELNAYNFETILAEKIQTILDRGISNSRSKDF